MTFGPVPLEQALGAILAHSLPLRTGRLRKGHILTRDDLNALQDAGFDTVSVARPGPDDMLENDAAWRLAQAVHNGAADLNLTPPFTGRVNIVAQHPGIVRVDAAQVTAVNRVDPMVTLATVQPFHQIHPGGLAATVKIISYAVPKASVEQASAAGRSAVTVARPIYRSASLIITEITGGPGEKGKQAIADRVTGLGMTLIETLVCPHDEAALVTCLQKVQGEMILVLTGSATSDPCDTAPQAVRQAGGYVSRFGLPVDPGNLLFLGALQNRPVIGLPGSARSPVLHGADWIFSRVACGVEISDDDFAAMGVGGLLKEIPTRPQPRHRT